MMTFDRIFRLFVKAAVLPAAVVLVMILGSCGYHMGTMMHPQIKTIAFADIKNDTKEAMLISILRGQLAEQFQTDGSLKVVDKESADCILYCRVVNVDNHVIRTGSTDGQQTYRPKEFRITITADFTVLIPGRSEPLIPLRRISGTSLYQYESDPQVLRLAGLKLASRDLAKMAVQYTTEAW